MRRFTLVFLLIFLLVPTVASASVQPDKGSGSAAVSSLTPTTCDGFGKRKICFDGKVYWRHVGHRYIVKLITVFKTKRLVSFTGACQELQSISGKFKDDECNGWRNLRKAHSFVSVLKIPENYLDTNVFKFSVSHGTTKIFNDDCVLRLQKRKGSCSVTGGIA